MLVCLDFDGTLAPIAESPAEPTITPENERAVRLLSDNPSIRVGIISGRELSDLTDRVGITDLVYAGNHGLEMMDGADRVVNPDAAQRRPAIQWAARTLEERTAEVPGATIENKGLSLTVHYRQVPSARKSEVKRAVESLTGPDEDIPDGIDADEFRLVPGKQSIEIRPAVEWDKGMAVRELVDDSPSDWRAAYIGDDTTDEDAFQVLGPEDIDVFVGSGETTATYRIRDQSEVAPFLEWIAETV